MSSLFSSLPSGRQGRVPPSNTRTPFSTTHAGIERMMTMHGGRLHARTHASEHELRGYSRGRVRMYFRSRSGWSSANVSMRGLVRDRNALTLRPASRIQAGTFCQVDEGNLFDPALRCERAGSCARAPNMNVGPDEDILTSLGCWGVALAPRWLRLVPCPTSLPSSGQTCSRATKELESGIHSRASTHANSVGLWTCPSNHDPSDDFMAASSPIQ